MNKTFRQDLEFFLFIVLIALTFTSIGCASLPTKKEIAGFDYGQPLTVDYKKVIQDRLERVLLDPYSAQCKFAEPKKFWYKEPPLLGSNLHTGYMVFVRINAKNRMGAYVGMKTYGFLFKDNILIKFLRPREIYAMHLVAKK
jgi:hypothetical protein